MKITIEVEIDDPTEEDLADYESTLHFARESRPEIVAKIHNDEFTILGVLESQP